MAKNNNMNMSQLFTVMNRIAAEQGISKKEAYQLAKKQLEQKPATLDDARELIAQMRTRNVKFQFLNRHGKVITTTGTLVMSKVPTNRKVEGSQTPKDSQHIVFYDVRHGVFRQFDTRKVVAVL